MTNPDISLLNELCDATPSADFVYYSLLQQCYGALPVPPFTDKTGVVYPLPPLD